MAQRIDIYLDGVRADLSQDAELALTFAINNLSDIKRRQGSFSVDYPLPFTSTNNRILKNANQADSASNKPYVKIASRIDADGVPQMYGYCWVKGTVDSYSCTFFGDNSDWIDQLGDKKLSDLSLSEYDHLWNQSVVLASASNGHEQGFIYPNVNNGRMNDRSFESGVTFDELYFALFRRMLLEKIVSEAGYVLLGGFPSIVEFENSIIPFTNDKLVPSKTYIQQFSVEAIDQAGRTVFTESNIIEAHQANTVTKDDKGQFVANVFTAEKQGVVTVTVKPNIHLVGDAVIIIYYIDATSSGTGEQKRLTKFSKGGSIDTYITSKNSVSFEVKPGDTISITDFFSAFPGSATVTYLPTDNYVKFEFDERIYPGDLIEINQNTPDITQSDFIRSIANEFCLLFIGDAKRKTIRMEPFEIVVANRGNPVDWSKKTDHTTRPELDFSYGEYGQDSKFTYTTDSNDSELVAEPTFGNGSFLVNNEHLEQSKVVFESVYAATKDKLSFFGELPLPYVPIFQPKENTRYSVWIDSEIYNTTPTQDFVNHRGRYFRALINNIDRDKPPLYFEDGEWHVNFGEWVEGTYRQFTERELFAVRSIKPRVLVIDRTVSIPIRIYDQVADSWTYHDVPATFEPMRFDTALLPTYYEALQISFQKTKVIKVQVRLNAVDVGQLDFLRPVFLNVETPDYSIHGYFYIVEVSQFKPGSFESCEVSLLKMPNKVQGMFLPLTDYNEVDFSDADYN